MSNPPHIPVLLRETLAHLNLRTDQHVIDATLGLGGHSEAILKAIGARGKLMAFEQDGENLKRAQERLKPFEKQVIYCHTNFERLGAMVKKHHFGPVNAILFDLGLSSPHLDNPARGFSFRQEGPLDMRFDPRAEVTAAMIVNRMKEKDLADLIYRYGEERRSRKIARAIVEARREKPIKTTTELANIIAGTMRGRGKINPATLTFQALRIAVNRETEVLQAALDQAISVLAPNGRIAVLSYHSLEDRIVKAAFRHYTLTCICPREVQVCQCNFQKTLYILTKKPIIPSGIEVAENPRSRSARLRAAEKV